MTADPYNLSRIDSYRYLEQVSTRYSDQDAMGHINNVAYAAYIEAGRLGYFLNLMATSGKIDLNYVWQTSTSITAPKYIFPALFL